MRHRVILAMMLAMFARSVFACQCKEKPGIAAAAGLSSIVAVGRIQSLTPVRGLSVGATRLEGAVVVKLDVEASWKHAAQSLSILTAFSDCDYRDFQVGRRYLVFLDPEIGGLGHYPGLVWAPRCWPTRQVAATEALPVELGKSGVQQEPGKPAA